MKKSFNLLIDADWEPFLNYLLNMRGKGKLIVTINKYQKKRSLSANAYYFSCVVTPLAEHCGYTVDEMHDLLLRGYYGTETKEFRGLVIHVPRRRSTSPETADTVDFMGLTQHGQQIASELGITLPDQEKNNEQRAINN